MKVYTTSDVKRYYNDLITILYEKEYFSYEAQAQEYVDELVDDIKSSLPTRRHKPAPEYYDKYGKGMYYAAFTKNKRTTWYAFFTKYEENGEIIYLVRYIGNNHTEAHHLYEGF
jgi:hypothetical protein